MASVDKLTLVELIEAEKAKLSPEALEMWEELDTSLYMSPDEETRLKPHEAALMRSMGDLPQPDRRAIHILVELRAGLYQSEYSDKLGEPSQRHRDRCVISASHIKDRDERGPGEQADVEAVLQRTVEQALARLREGG